MPEPVVAGLTTPDARLRMKDSAVAFVTVLLFVASYLACVAFQIESIYWMIAIGGVFLAVCLIDLEIGLLGVPFVLLNPVKLEATGTNLILSEYILLIVFGVAFARMCLRPGGAFSFPRTMMLPALFLVGGAAASLVGASYPGAGLLMTVRYVELLIVLFLVVVNVCRSEQSLRRMGVSIIFSGLVSAIGAFAQFIANTSASGHSERVYGFLGGGFGAAMCVTLLMSLSAIIHRPSPGVRLLALVTIPVAGSALVLSQTRAWIGAFVLVTLAMILMSRGAARRRLVLVSTVVVLVVTIVLSTDLFGLVSHSVLSDSVQTAFRFGRRAGEYAAEDLSLYSRYVVWEYAINQFVHHPLLGIGIGNLRFATYLPVRLSPPVTAAGYVDDQYIQAFAEMGIVGGVAWLLYVFRALQLSGRARRRSGSVLQPIALGTHTSLLVLAVGSLFWVITPSHELFALMIVLTGMSVAMDRIGKSPPAALAHPLAVER